jgi:hypothetical protein
MELLMFQTYNQTIKERKTMNKTQQWVEEMKAMKRAKEEKFGVPFAKMDELFYFLDKLSKILFGNTDYRKSFTIQKGWIRVNDNLLNKADENLLRKHYFIQYKNSWVRPTVITKMYINKYFKSSKTKDLEVKAA